MNKLLTICLFAAACAGIPFAGFGGSSTAHHTETSSSTHEETVNGKPIAAADEPDEQPIKHEEKKSDIGKTCHHNNECAAEACFVGAGELGYCTKMCNSWSECPSHWDCKRARNAPQRICMQDAD